MGKGPISAHSGKAAYTKDLSTDKDSHGEWMSSKPCFFPHSVFSLSRRIFSIRSSFAFSLRLSFSMDERDLPPLMDQDEIDEIDDGLHRRRPYREMILNHHSRLRRVCNFQGRDRGSLHREMVSQASIRLRAKRTAKMNSKLKLE